MKVLYYTVAYTPDYLTLTNQMINSFKKFNKHDVKVFQMPDIQQILPNPMYDFTFSLTPLFLQRYINEYDVMVRLDGDMLILGNLDHVLEGDYDVAVSQNSSPFDWKNHLRFTGQRLSVYDINPLDYVNCGLVAVKSKRFAYHWWRMCNAPYFNKYPFREQDMLNLLVHYFPYNVKFLDHTPDNKWHGMIAKGYTPNAVLRDNKVILPKSEYPKEDKELVAFHYGGGVGGVKGKYRLIFSEEVSNYIDTLIK